MLTLEQNSKSKALTKFEPTGAFAPCPRRQRFGARPALSCIRLPLIAEHSNTRWTQKSMRWPIVFWCRNLSRLSSLSRSHIHNKDTILHVIRHQSTIFASEGTFVCCSWSPMNNSSFSLIIFIKYRLLKCFSCFKLFSAWICMTRGFSNHVFCKFVHARADW